MRKRLQLSVVAASTLIALSVSASIAAGAIAGPYAVDSHTLHLWHLDESAAPAMDQATYAYSGAFTTTSNANLAMNALFGTATLGAASYPGFGTALNNGTTPQNAGLSALTPANGTADNVDQTFAHPTTHAFTMEAVVKLSFSANSGNAMQEIVSGEGDGLTPPPFGGGIFDRAFQFRITGGSTNGVFNGALEFTNIYPTTGAGSSGSSLAYSAALPSTGPDAIVSDTWYHVAVTFNGDLADTTNLKFFWTALDADRTVANQIGTTRMTGWLNERDTDFTIGNETRDIFGSTEGFRGSIDEVRISDIARPSSGMQFVVPEPTSLGMMFVVTAMLKRPRRD